MDEQSRIEDQIQSSLDGRTYELPDDPLVSRLEKLIQELINRGGGGGGTVTITIDSALSGTSKNPVENRVITAALTKKADVNSPSLTGVPKTTTPRLGPMGDYIDNQIANVIFVKSLIESLVGDAPENMNTLKEIADVIEELQNKKIDLKPNSKDDDGIVLKGSEGQAGQMWGLDENQNPGWQDVPKFEQTQADWNVTSSTSSAYILNKPNLDKKADVNSPSLTGVPTAPTAENNTNTDQIATTKFVKNVVAALIDGAPETLDTLKEIADAIVDNQGIVDVLNNAISKKVDKEDGKGLSSNDFTDKDKIAANAQADWSITSSTSPAYILNKPDLDKSFFPLSGGIISTDGMELEINGFGIDGNGAQDIDNFDTIRAMNVKGDKLYYDNQDIDQRYIKSDSIPINTTTISGAVLASGDNPNKVWGTDSDGNPGWVDVASSEVENNTAEKAGIVSAGNDADSKSSVWGLDNDWNPLWKRLQELMIVDGTTPLTTEVDRVRFIKRYRWAVGLDTDETSTKTCYVLDLGGDTEGNQINFIFDYDYELLENRGIYARYPIKDSDGDWTMSPPVRLAFSSDVAASIVELETKLNFKADIDSPTLTGLPTAPTPENADNSTRIATTAFVKTLINELKNVDHITINKTIIDPNDQENALKSKIEIGKNVGDYSIIEILEENVNNFEYYISQLSGSSIKFLTYDDEQLSISPYSYYTNMLSITFKIAQYTSYTLTNLNFYATNSNNISIGTSLHKWKEVYAINGTIQTSDRNEKNSFVELTTEKAESLIYGLKPTTYMMNSGSSGRIHWGLISQDLEELLEELGWTSLDFAGFIKSPKMTEPVIDEKTGKTIKESEIIEGEYTYSLRYDEFIAPIIKIEQSHNKRIKELEVKIVQQEAEIMDLKTQIEELKNIILGGSS